MSYLKDFFLSNALQGELISYFNPSSSARGHDKYAKSMQLHLIKSVKVFA